MNELRLLSSEIKSTNKQPRDYENFLSPDEKLHWICLNKMKVSVVKIFFKTLLASVKTIYLVRGWSTFLGWLLCINKYSTYIKYCEIIKQFKNLKIAIIDYDCLCPKVLLLAFKASAKYYSRDQLQRRITNYKSDLKNLLTKIMQPP